MIRYTWKITLCYYGCLKPSVLACDTADPDKARNKRERILDFLDALLDNGDIDWYGVEESTERMGQ